MRFELDHDWQGNMANPIARVGERTKLHLMLLLCVTWLCMGLIGHAPWKPYEPHTMSIVKHIIQHGQIIAPLAASHPTETEPPLYFWTAAASAKLFAPMISMHNAARLITGVWMALTLLLLGMTGRELWGKGTGRQTVLIFIGSVGLIINAHTLTPEVSALTGVAMALYALALGRRRPYRAGALLGSGIGIGFLSTGIIPVLIMVICAIILPLCFKQWRNKAYKTMLVIALIATTPWLLIWPVLCYRAEPEHFLAWWHNVAHEFTPLQLNQWYFLRIILTWYAWPATPLALWGLWRFRSQLLNQEKFQLILTFFITALFLIGFADDAVDIYALPLLLPVALLAGGCVETLKRGAANALNWFGLMLFGLVAFLIWTGWIAMLSGSPMRIAARMQFLSGTLVADFNIFAFILAITISLIWLISIFKSQYSNRAAVTNWAVGMTMGWTLLMTLWLPWINATKSYQPVMLSLKQALPTHYNCISGINIKDPQRDLLFYYADLSITPVNSAADSICKLSLILDDNQGTALAPNATWKLIWSGKRNSDRHERLSLFQRSEP